MATEELTLVINDAQLNLTLTKINMIKTAQTRTTTQVKGLSSLITKARKDAKAAGISLDDLPTLNRDMRLIMGRFPGFMQASRIFFQTRRAVRAAQLEREAAALRELAPELAQQLGTAAFIGKIALVVYAVTAVIRIAEKIEKMQRQIIQQRGAYETMIRDGLDLTHEEWALMDRERVGWVTAWDAFVEKSKTDLFGAIDDFIRAKYVEITVEVEAAILTDGKGVAEEFYP